MSFVSRLLGIFTRGGRDEGMLLQGVEHAKAKRPEKAIAIYNELIENKGTSPQVRGRALFNRSLAYSAMKEDDKALADLQEVLKIPHLPENVMTAARERVTRLRNRH
jgi:pentatricopeptide repeat protein